MTHRWLVSVPVWGERYVEVFCSVALPALEQAFKQVPDLDVRLVVHTDQPDRIRDGATEIPIETRPVPAGARSFDCMSQAHRQVLDMAMMHDRVMLLTADLVLSKEGLRACDEILHPGNKFLVACAGVRAVEEGVVPITKSASRLMKWAWDHRHPMTEECRWPDGRSRDLSRLYFEKDGTVLTRLCLPHPLAVRIDGRLLRFNPTIDVNLINNFHVAEIHMVTTSDRLALVELSPRNKDFAINGPMIDQYDSGSIVIPGGMQTWCMKHKIMLVGNEPVDCGDDEVMSRILKDG